MSFKEILKKIANIRGGIISTTIFNTERFDLTRHNNNQINPFVLNWYFRLYIEEEYIKNMDFFLFIKEEASDKEVKCRFNKTFMDQSRQLSEKKFVLPAEFIDEDGNTRIGNAYFRGTTVKNVKINGLMVEKVTGN